jgi:hypothetical protein
VIGRAVAFFIEPFGLSHIEPIGRLIRGTLEAALIDESFEQAKGMAKIGKPVLSEGFDIEGEKPRGKVRDLDIGDNEEASILGDLMEVLFFDSVRPSDELIPAGNPPGRGAPAEAGHDLTVKEGHILKVSSNDLAIAQVMVTMDKAVIKGFERSAPNHLEFERAELGESSFQWGFQGLDHGRPPIPSFIKGRVLPWRELNQPHPCQAQEDLPAGHIFEVSVGLVPLPLTA